MECGRVSISRNSGVNTVSVSLSKPFTATPIIFVSISSLVPNQLIPSYTGESVTGFTAILYNTGATISGNVNVRWLAVQP